MNLSKRSGPVHFRRRVERYLYHVVHAALALFGRELLGAVDVVAYGAQAERPLPAAGGGHVEARGLHLHGEDAHPLPLVVAVAAVVVEVVRAHDVAGLYLYAARGGAFGGGLQERPVRYRREGPLEAELVGEVGVRAGAEGADDVAQPQLVGYAARGADADDVLDAVAVVELPAVNPDAGYAHAARHDGDARALPEPGVALDAADVIYEHGVLEEGLGYVLRAQRVARHEHGLREIALIRAVVRGRHRITSVI